MGDADVERLAAQASVRDRLPDYAAVFGAGLAAAAAVGVVIGALSSATVGHAVGYSLVAFGAALLLGGGLSGGGYSVLGVGEGIGRRTFMQGDGNRLVMEGLRAGYRPRANPGAFWRVIGGLLYVAIGVVLILVTS